MHPPRGNLHEAPFRQMVHVLLAWLIVRVRVRITIYDILRYPAAKGRPRTTTAAGTVFKFFLFPNLVCHIPR